MENMLYYTTKDYWVKNYYSCILDITIMKERDNWCSYFRTNESCIAGCRRIGFLTYDGRVASCFWQSVSSLPLPLRTRFETLMALRMTMDIHSLRNILRHQIKSSIFTGHSSKASFIWLKNKNAFFVSYFPNKNSRPNKILFQMLTCKLTFSAVPFWTTFPFLWPLFKGTKQTSIFHQPDKHSLLLVSKHENCQQKWQKTTGFKIKHYFTQCFT